MHQSNPPHTQKRVTVPVSLDVLQAFQELASVSGVSTGKAMGDWLADTLDGVSLMTDLLRKAKEAPRLAALEIQAYGRGISGLADDILHDLRAKSSGASAASEVGGAPPRGEAPSAGAADAPSLSDTLAAMRSRASDRSPGGATGTLSPPYSNTGGKVPQKVTNPPSRRAAERGKK
jgi:hypothetical protein